MSTFVDAPSSSLDDKPAHFLPTDAATDQRATRRCVSANGAGTSGLVRLHSFDDARRRPEDDRVEQEVLFDERDRRVVAPDDNLSARTFEAARCRPFERPLAPELLRGCAVARAEGDACPGAE